MKCIAATDIGENDFRRAICAKSTCMPSIMDEGWQERCTIYMCKYSISRKHY
jgi:hypothetical protein